MEIFVKLLFISVSDDLNMPSLMHARSKYLLCLSYLLWWFLLFIIICVSSLALFYLILVFVELIIHNKHKQGFLICNLLPFHQSLSVFLIIYLS